MGFIIKAAGSMLVMASVVGLSMLGSQMADKLNMTDRLLQAEQEKQRLREENEQLTERNQKLAMANRLLKVEYQLARVRMKGQERDPATSDMISVVEFWEVDDNGEPLTRPQTFRIKGDRVYVEGLVFKFDDSLVEQGDPLRGTAMFALTSIHGNKEAPDNGYSLHSNRTQPGSYARGGLTTAFEEKMWRDFWDIAHDPVRKQELRLRSNHGQATFMKLEEGVEYEIKMRSTGDVSFDPLKEAAKGVLNSARNVGHVSRRAP
jgi:hypothetical protein